MTCTIMKKKIEKYGYRGEHMFKILKRMNKKCTIESTLPKNVNFNPSQTIKWNESQYRSMLVIADRIQCVERYIADGIPSAFTCQDVESNVYNKGAICCSKYKGVVLFTNFSCTGGLNTKGQLEYIQPITFDGKTLPIKKRCYGVNGEYDYDEDCAVIIQDYTGAIQGDKIVPRAYINNMTTINDEVKTYRQLVLNVIMNVKKLLVRCENEEQAKININQAINLLDPTQLVVAMRDTELTNSIEMQSFVDKVDITGLTQAIEFYSKSRRQFNGVPCPTSYEKKERMISDEVSDYGTAGNLILYDGLMQRKIAYDRINKCFGTNISVRINPIILGGNDNNGTIHEDVQV